jgi:hypothetical protein
MAATLATLLAMCQELLGTTTVFSTTILTDFINRAIEDLSIYFPLYSEYDISCTAHAHTYDLENYIKGVVSVEYPQGEDPPRYSLRKSYTDPDFWIHDGYYDIIKYQSSDSTVPPQIVVSDTTILAQKIRIKCIIDHSALADPGDECTVLERHTNLILQFVRWKAFQYLSAKESEDPSPLNTRASSFEINAQRAELAYRDALKAAASAESESAQAPWKMDRFDSIY